MPRYLLEVMYDGTAFNGSQLQGLQPTVQLSINQALSTLLREPIETFGASRTDRDVHALSNYYHFDTESNLKESFTYNLNAILPESIAAKGIFITERNDFNARFDAIKRTYRYRINNRKDPFKVKRVLHYPFRIDEQILSETAEIIKRYTNFESFSKRNTQSKTFNCTIYQSYWEKKDDELHYVVVANRFLRGMVRALVGTQLLAARGKTSVQGFIDIIESKDCSNADFSVAGHGLYLEEIEYPEGSFRAINLTAKK